MKETLSINELKNKCVDLKKNVVHMIYKAQSGHPGGSLSVAGLHDGLLLACHGRGSEKPQVGRP